MLLISNLVLVGTAGLSWAATAWHVRRVAARIQDSPRDSGPIVVLGAPAGSTGPGKELRERLLRGKALFDLGMADRLIILGGAPDGGPISEAASGRDFLIRQGLPGSAIATEESSRHTLENLRNLRHLLSPDDTGPVLLITHRYHAARVAAIAHGLRIPHEVVAADSASKPRLGLIRLGHEAYMLHWYVVGRAVATWLGHESSLAKIS